MNINQGIFALPNIFEMPLDLCKAKATSNTCHAFCRIRLVQNQVPILRALWNQNQLQAWRNTLPSCQEIPQPTFFCWKVAALRIPLQSWGGVNLHAKPICQGSLGIIERWQKSTNWALRSQHKVNSAQNQAEVPWWLGDAWLMSKSALLMGCFITLGKQKRKSSPIMNN